ncbi:hypothetical protein [Streptococcus orisratti]|uniref:hypothetical protein n=1 Tax=Streptococcus orisratti TaxID=114652 RepID=UPI0023F73F57|nr:hypothetical protein [Streptococcus orisratti]
MFKPNLTTGELLHDYTAKVIEVTTRKAKKEFNNSTDVSEYPSLVKFVITNDTKNVNDGQKIFVKLKSADNLTVGDIIDFKSSQIVNGIVHFWARKSYVNVSIKGDSISVIE